MQIKRYAGIDIGSNAARLIIKDLHPTENNKYLLKKRVFIRLPLRIGNDVFSKGKICDEKIQEFINAVKIFKDLLKYNDVSVYRACATSALRNAENQKDIVEIIKNETGISIDVIDGFEEAELLFLTNREKLKKGKFYMSADLGGGSLQLALFRYKKLIRAYTYKTGTLRFVTKTIKQSEIDALEKKVIKLKKEYPEAELMGSGGNINKISKMIGKKNVTFDDMKNLYNKLNKISYIDRIKKYSLREDRADVIMPALKLYMRIMKVSGSDRIFVPKTGLADGIIRSLFLEDYGLKKLEF